MSTICIVYIDLGGKERHYQGVFDTYELAKKCLMDNGCRSEPYTYFKRGGIKTEGERIFVTSEFIKNASREYNEEVPGFEIYFQECLAECNYWFSFDIIETNKIVRGCSSDLL